MAIRIRGVVRCDERTEHGELWVHDGRVRFERPADVRDEDVDSLEGFVLPGLVDAHCHVGLDAKGAVAPEVARTQAVTDRDAGTLLIRDAGSPADTRWMDHEPDLPRVIRAGRHIARTRRYLKNYAHEIEPEQLPAVMAAQATRGDGWVKIVGDWIDRSVGDLTPCWPQDAVRAGIEAAHAEGARVTAHCFGEQVLGELAQAGIDCVEHATGLTPDTVDEFARRRIAVVPTLVNIRQFPASAEPATTKYPVYQRHMLDLWHRRHRTVAMAYEAGVPLYTGTDAGGSVSHGLLAQEVEELVAAGVPVLEAVGAATWRGREWLGQAGLTDGSPADLVVYPADPLEDVAVLRYPRAVILRGHVVG